MTGVWKFASASFVKSMPGIVVLGPSFSTPVLCITTAFTRGSLAAASAWRPPQLQPETATCFGSMRPKYGLPERWFSASAQSSAAVRSAATVRAGSG